MPLNSTIKSGYKQTEVGMIPEDWFPTPLPDICWFQEGPGVRTHQFRNSGVKLLNGTNIVNGEVRLDTTTRHISLAEASGAYKHFLVDAGDILLATSGITIDKLHEKVAIAQFEQLPLCMNTSTVRFKVYAQKIVDDYLYFFLQSDLFKTQIERQATGSAQLNFGPSHLAKVMLPLPSLEDEQHAIAAALSDVDDLIGVLDTLIIKKRDLKQAAMQQLLTGKQRLPGFNDQWELKRLGDVADIDPDNLGSDTPAQYAFNYISLEDVDVGSLRSYSEQVFGTAPSRARRRLKADDILVSTVRPNLQSHLLFASTQPDWICSTGFSVVRCRRQDAIPGYVFFHLFGYTVTKQIEALLTGSNYPAINGKDVKALEIPIPSLPEQAAIVAVLSDMDAEITALSQRRDKTRALKEGMMQELLTGKTRLI